MSLDEIWMKRALALAKRGARSVYPNPMVGAVLVHGGKLLAEGYHHAYGEKHAEVEAIIKATKRGSEGARGSTLYVNLEPCAHWGKTPPCADAVIKAGITRVVAAMKDPNPLVAGKGFARLKKAGIQVFVGVKESAARRLNRDFLKRMKAPRPYVILKRATSLDGRMSTITGESKWITSVASRRAGHRLRARVDAIAVGANTIRRDNPTLTAHGMGKNPIRIVFAGRRPVSKKANVFDRSAPTWIIQRARGPVALRAALGDLGRKGIRRLLVEGGPTLQESFLEAGIVDEVVSFVAPILIGQSKTLKKAWRLQGARDICVRGRIG